ncbi:MAG: hypothetical protein KAR39_11015 [Thermoplasmata archaeon]|nr:hypothetical protein [Thermoplasmata archaeon]
MEEETYVEEEVEMMEEPLDACPICNSEIAADQKTIECDWCAVELHEDCEHTREKCPRCKRYLPSAKLKALASDRRSTAVLIFLPFVVIEIIIAIFSWMNHPSSISVPDLDNWFSIGLIVNAILLIVALVTMGSAARRGEGVKKSATSKSHSETGSQ